MRYWWTLPPVWAEPGEANTLGRFLCEVVVVDAASVGVDVVSEPSFAVLDPLAVSPERLPRTRQPRASSVAVYAEVLVEDVQEARA